MKAKVAVIGAGFSGLSIAWALQKRGVSCEVFERQEKPGGMISSQYDRILFESAANAVLASQNFEELLQDLNIQPIKAGFKSNARWIYRNGVKKMPLSIAELLSGLSNLFLAWIKGELKAKPDESVADWSARNLNQAFTDYLLTPALQGIYSTEAQFLSAELVFGSIFKKDLKLKKAQLKGSLSAPKGMGQIVTELAIYLENKGIKINYNSSPLDEYEIRVIATSISDAAGLLESTAPKAAKALKEIPLNPLSTVVMGFEKQRSLKGFGCLFPRDQKISALGVLFNTDIFAGRGELESETWIYAQSSAHVESALADRKLLLGVSESPAIQRTQEWPKALPLYGKKLRELLVSDIWKTSDARDPFAILKNGAELSETKNRTFLTGNYLGGIGLAKILDYNLRLADKIAGIRT
ncbi:MAG: protoporphyrinogen/coproporphyrinogen oxidase [Pseudobdellovibrio sp.]